MSFIPISEEAFRRLGHHPVLSAGQQALYEQNRAKAIELFTYWETLGGRGSRELSLALTHLQEALMWANAHVACNDVESYHGPEVTP